MFGSGAFDYIDVLNTAANAKMLRNELLSNNIANDNTPGYKRKDLEFEVHLNRAIESAGGERDSLTKKIRNMDLSEARMMIYADNSDLSYRLDENNVDQSVEQAELAANQIQYNALIDSMTHEFSRIKSVLT